MNTILLIIEERSAVAALVPAAVTDLQLDIIYCLLPSRQQVHCHAELSARWSHGVEVQLKPSHIPMPACRVLCSPEWAAVQLKRIPCVPPKQTVKLAFL